MAKKKLSATSGWQIETLVKRAFERTKSRFLSYLFVYVMGAGITIAVILATSLVGVLFIVLANVAHLVPVAIVLGVLVAVAGVAALFYFLSWIQLTILKVFVQEKQVGVVETMKSVRPIVPGFILLNVLILLFILGLLPFGVLSLGIILLLWGFWGAFAGFIYLEKQPAGMKSLWMSRKMVNQNFWGVAGRFLLVGAVLYLVIIAFTLSNNQFLKSLSPLLSFLATPFFISFAYELYKGLKMPAAATGAPKVWVTISVLGWVLSLVVVLTAGVYIGGFFNQMIRQREQMMPYQRHFVPPPHSMPPVFNNYPAR